MKTFDVNNRFVYRLALSCEPMVNVVQLRQSSRLAAFSAELVNGSFEPPVPHLQLIANETAHPVHRAAVSEAGEAVALVFRKQLGIFGDLVPGHGHTAARACRGTVGTP